MYKLERAEDVDKYRPVVNTDLIRYQIWSPYFVAAMDVNDILKRYSSASPFHGGGKPLDDLEREQLLVRIEEWERALKGLLSEMQSFKIDLHFKTRFTERNTLTSYWDPTVVEHRAPALFTSGGSTKGIREKIREVLRIRLEPMTSAELAEAIYVYDPRVSFDLFKRRVIVAASAMYREDSPPQLVPSDRKGSGREVYWALPEWQHAENQYHILTP